jgi:hypothetical protein
MNIMNEIIKAIKVSMALKTEPNKTIEQTENEKRFIQNLQRANYSGLLRIRETSEGMNVLTWPFLEEILACPYTDEAFLFSQVRVYDLKNNRIKGKVDEHFSSSSGMVKLLPNGIDEVKNLLATYSIAAKKHFK